MDETIFFLFKANKLHKRNNQLSHTGKICCERKNEIVTILAPFNSSGE